MSCEVGCGRLRGLVDGVVGQEDAWRGIFLPVGPEERYEASGYAQQQTDL
jgi:hypothetical protein